MYDYCFHSETFWFSINIDSEIDYLNCYFHILSLQISKRRPSCSRQAAGLVEQALEMC